MPPPCPVHVHRPARAGVISAPPRGTIAAFDFDVTITSRDTFVPFLYRAFGKPRTVAAFCKMSREAACIALGISNRDTFKEGIVNALFAGQPVAGMSEVGRMYASEILGWVRPAAVRRIQWHRSNGHRLVMVSASLDIYLRHVADALGFDDLLCTVPHAVDGVYDGTLTDRNCRGPEKVNRLTRLVGDLRQYELYAYGDSAGDRELLGSADHPFLRAFEPGGALACE